MFSCFFDVNLSYSMVAVIAKPKKNISFKCNHNPRTGNGIDSLLVVPSM